MSSLLETITRTPPGTKLMVCEPVQVRTSAFMGREAATLQPGKHLRLLEVHNGEMLCEDLAGDLLSIDLSMAEHMEIAR